jgi:hypothetical protein
VGSRADLDTEFRGKILCLCRGSNLDRPVIHSVAILSYTDSPIMSHTRGKSTHCSRSPQHPHSRKCFRKSSPRFTLCQSAFSDSSVFIVTRRNRPKTRWKEGVLREMEEYGLQDEWKNIFRRRLGVERRCHTS